MADANIDVSKLAPEDLSFYKKFGRLPPKKRAGKGPMGRLSNHGERKYFDSADQAMAAAGIKTDPGKVIAKPGNIPVPSRTNSRPSGMTKEAAAPSEGEDAGEAPAAAAPAAKPAAESRVGKVTAI